VLEHQGALLGFAVDREALGLERQGKRVIRRTSMKTGPIGNRDIYRRLQPLKVGEVLTLKTSEWKAATPPTDLRYNPTYRGQFSVHELEHGTGWLIVRLK
jgi:hypothetical protein